MNRNSRKNQLAWRKNNTNNTITIRTEAEQSPFAADPIGKLIAKFAIPCVTSLLVNALHNIVDQIFIGRGVGYLGNGTTNVVFPITAIALAAALFTGDGGAAYLGLRLGEGGKESVQKGVGGIVTMVITAGLVTPVAALLFMESIANLLDATDNLRPYALNYGYIIVIGLSFAMTSTALNSIIRADGSPKFAMTSMLLGATINTILDPIFIFPLQMGVQGAAIATILGQMASFAMPAVYLRHFKSVDMKKSCLRLDNTICRRVLGLGISSFITQPSIAVMVSVSNNLLTTYGVQSVYDAKVPLTAMGIVIKVNQILIPILVRIAAGPQPTIGYNHGVGDHARAKKISFIIILAAEAVIIVVFLVFQFLPMGVVSLFGSEEGLYNEFAIKCFRIFLLFCVLNGFQTVAGIYMQATGEFIKAAAISLSYQIVSMIPAVIVFPTFMGVEGVLWADPVAGGLTFTLTLVLTMLEIRHLNRNRETENQTVFGSTAICAEQ